MVRVPDAKSDCSHQGKAEVRITTWSEFQVPSQTAPTKAKPRCVYSILNPHGQIFRRPVRPLLSKANPSYIYSNLKPHGQSCITPQSRSKAVVCVSTPRMYPRSGYFLVISKMKFVFIIAYSFLDEITINRNNMGWEEITSHKIERMLDFCW